MPFFFASASCALVRPSVLPTLGQVSLLINTEPPSSVVYSGCTLISGRRLKLCTAACESVTCQPKCQIALCGVLAGGWSTLSNSTITSLGENSAIWPPQLPLDVLGNCRV